MSLQFPSLLALIICRPYLQLGSLGPARLGRIVLDGFAAVPRLADWRAPRSQDRTSGKCFFLRIPSESDPRLSPGTVTLLFRYPTQTSN